MILIKEVGRYNVELNLKRIDEFSLSRVFAKVLEHDTGTITGFRDKDFDKQGNVTHEYTHKENQARNRSLLAKLLISGFRATSVEGTYIENYGTPQAVEVGETVFFVEDYADRGNLKKYLMKFGEMFNQDSILYIPKGAKQSFLIGTNHTSEFPGYHKEIKFNHFGLGRSGEFMTKVRGRPFLFEQTTDVYTPSLGFHGHWGLATIARKEWRDLIEE